MIQSERVCHLESQTFIISKNVDGFPVQRISFSSPQSKEEINGTLQGEGITSGKFTGRLIATDQIELFSCGLTYRHRVLLLEKCLDFFVGMHPKKCRFFSTGIACTANKVMEPQVIFNCSNYNDVIYAISKKKDIRVIIIGYVLL